jgi:hypothetical protein
MAAFNGAIDYVQAARHNQAPRGFYAYEPGRIAFSHISVPEPSPMVREELKVAIAGLQLMYEIVPMYGFRHAIAREARLCLERTGWSLDWHFGRGTQLEYSVVARGETDGELVIVAIHLRNRRLACRRVCATILQHARRFLPRDMAILLARTVWTTKWDEGWETTANTM